MEFELDNPEALEALGMLGAMAWCHAVVAGTLLDKHEALASERAIRDGGLVSVKIDPMLDPIRGEPRLRAVMMKMNFPA